MIATDLDVNTLFMVTMHVEVMLGLLLFFAWAQNFSKTALAWWGSAHLLRAISIMLFGMHGSIPDWVSIDVANAVLFGSFAVTWSGARVFDRRTAEPVWCMVGVIIWLLACRLPQFSASIEMRALIGSFIVTTYTWLAAYEFWRGRDEALVSRWPAIFMLFAHGALFLLRTPLGAMFNLSPANVFSQSAWLELISVEAVLFTISIAFILLAMAKERTEYRHRAAARTDELTGILNRRGFLEQSASSNRWAMDLRPTAVMLVDLDNFKSINDRFGHAVGDHALRIFAETARSSMPSEGLVGRWGGDEFAVVLYDTDRDDAAIAAKRMQVAFQNAAANIDGHAVAATLSIGMVFSAAGPLDLPALLVQADEALYLAKELGRNRIEVASPETVWKSGGTSTHDVAPEPLPLRRHETAA
jgi:diguanylate cyclase (GGDEF)-like protein